MLWVHAFFQGAAISYFFLAANALFLTHFRIESLPLLLALAAGVQLAIGRIASSLEHRFSQSTFFYILLFVMLVGVALFRVISFLSVATWVIGGMMIWSKVMEYVHHSEFWGLSSQLFDVRQSKRLFSLIDSGSFIAKILASLSVPVLTAFLSVPDLLTLSVVSLGISFFVLRKIVARSKSHLEHRSHSKHRPVYIGRRLQRIREQLLENRFIAVLGAVAFLSVVATACFNFGFLCEVELKYSEESEIAFFLGLFFGIGRIASFVLKTVLARRLYSSWGLAYSIGVLPAALLLTTALGFVLRPFVPSEHILLYLFTLNMLLIEVWVEAIHTPAVLVAMQPLPAHERLRGHNIIYGAVEPVGLGLAGLMLWGLVSYQNFTLFSLSIILLAVLGLWLAASKVLGLDYRAIVKRAMRHRFAEMKDLEWDETSRAILRERLKSPHAGEVTYALSLIPVESSDFLIDELPKLLEHRSETVRVHAIRKLESSRLSLEQKRLVRPLIERSIEVDKSNAVTGEALRAFAELTSEEDLAILEPYLNATDPLVTKGLLSGILRYRGIDGVLLAGERLQRLIASDRPEERILGAEVIGDVGVRNFYHPIIRLLDDMVAEVREAALRAASRVRHPRLLPRIASILFEEGAPRSLIEQTIETLTQFGNDAIEEIGKLVSANNHLSGTALLRVIRFVSKSPCSISHNILVAIIRDETLRPGYADLRLAALHALSEEHYQCNAEDRSFFELELRKESEHARSLLRTSNQLSTSSFAANASQGFTVANRALMSDRVGLQSLIRHALEWEFEQSRARALSLLSILHDSQMIASVRENLLFGKPEHRANAIELLENSLPKKLASEVLWMFELGLDLKRASSGIGISQLRTEEPLAWMAANQSSLLDAWTSSLAIYTAAGNGRGLSAVVNANTSTASSEFALTEKTMSQTFERVLILKSVDLFSETSENVLAHIARALEEEHVSPGATFIQKGELGTCLYIVVEGKVRVHDDEHTLAMLGSRDVVGELSLLDPEPRSAFVTAEEDTYLLKLDRDAFYDIMADRIDVAKGALAMLSRRLRTQNAIIRDLKSKHAASEPHSAE